MAESYLDLSTTSNRWRRYSEEYLNEARFHFIEVVKSSLTVTTFLIGFNVIWLQLTTGNETGIVIKILFLLSLISMVISITFGIGTLLGANNFLNNVSEDYYARSEKLNQYIFDSGENHTREFPNHIAKHQLNGKYLPWLFWAQLTTLGLGGVLTLSSAVAQLFFQ